MEKSPKHARRGPSTICFGYEESRQEPFNVIFWNDGHVSWFGGWFIERLTGIETRRHVKAGAQYIIRVTPK